MTRTLDGLESALAVLGLSSPPYSDALSILCVQLTRDLLVIAKFLLCKPTQTYPNEKPPQITIINYTVQKRN